MDGPAWDVSEKELAKLHEELRRTLANWEPPRLLTPLPRRARLRLAVSHKVDRAAIWLVDRRHLRTAGLLWKTFRLWP